jgi:hypothetical protein
MTLYMAIASGIISLTVAALFDLHIRGSLLSHALKQFSQLKQEVRMQSRSSGSDFDKRITLQKIRPSRWNL